MYAGERACRDLSSTLVDDDVMQVCFEPPTISRFSNAISRSLVHCLVANQVLPFFGHSC